MLENLRLYFNVNKAYIRYSFESIQINQSAFFRYLIKNQKNQIVYNIIRN